MYEKRIPILMNRRTTNDLRYQVFLKQIFHSWQTIPCLEEEDWYTLPNFKASTSTFKDYKENARNKGG